LEEKLPMADITKEDVIEFIANMSVLELSEMVKEMEEKFGVSAAAPVAMMAAGPAGEGGGADAAEEKNEFDVVLTAAGDKKIAVIKEVRAITGLGIERSQGTG
jgi:large subunit ribosomal protein L7/L12